MNSSAWMAAAERAVRGFQRRALRLMIAPYFAVAGLNRRRLRETTFIGVTGSCAKTTTKDLIAAVLGSRFAGRKSPGTHNISHWVARTILATRAHHRFCVQEAASAGPGTIDATLRILRPDIAVVTTIGSDHYKAFRTREATANEKGKLVAAVPESGTAILNADDPYVITMRERCAGRVVTYGLAPEAELRATDVRSPWPERLHFTVTWNGDSLPVRTRLCGTHWVHSVLAALASGLVMGVPLEEGARAVESVAPWAGRMSPIVLADGVTFLRDDAKASLSSIPPALEFVRDATAGRKIVVFGTISDYPGSSSRTYRSVAEQALEVADHVLFVGRQAKRALGAKRHRHGHLLETFPTVQGAAEHLRHFLRADDLVLLKGSNRADHLVRLILDRSTRVECWRTSCGRTRFCDECRLLRVPFAPEDLGSSPEPAAAVEGV
ncbi:UDP-N-acetylmuramoyl-tripeptide--D-alanyl-D-alanine ligase [soil metagenome]